MTEICGTGDVLIDARYDQGLRWREGERLDHLFEARCDELRASGQGGRLAVTSAQVRLTYDDLDARANQLARYLSRRGVGAGDRVALLFDEAVDGYVGMLAVLKLNAAYVPLDTGYPTDRLDVIMSDAAVRTVLSHSRCKPLLRTTRCDVVCLDEHADAIAEQDAGRLTAREKGPAVDELCYVVYTSGSTGRPKGVAIDHASICNFVRVAAQVYGLTAADRVYQGMTIAFDFSVEEIWVPWMVGATLVPKPRGPALLGRELRDFLVTSRVTALCCVPTLLATLEDDVPDLRFLLLSGEACPQDLIARWYRPDRRLLNVYGPTETTVTATWTLPHPDRRVTIGVPLPTYSVVVLERDVVRPVPRGAVGEICVAGVGLARGYLNRPDLTARAFVDDVLGIPGNPSGRIYRTGDLGRVDDHGEIEYLGRIDAQIKIRGYRIELAEIESALLQLPGIATAVVQPYEAPSGVTELAAYYCRRSDAPAVPPTVVGDHLRRRLPPYMVPAYIEELDTLPMLPSDKVDRRRLPTPRRESRLGGGGSHVEPRSPTEAALARTLADVLGLERVSAQAHFFDDLGANSLVMARFCARVREHPDLARPAGAVSMKDVYLNPDVHQLAAMLDAAASPADEAQEETASVGRPLPRRQGTPLQSEPSAGGRRPGAWRYSMCGIVQAVLMLGYTYLLSFAGVAGLRWVGASPGPSQAYLRTLLLGALVFAGLLAIPVTAKWLLIGRWTPRDIPVWSVVYLRFWIVHTLIRFSVAPLLAGSPLYVLYLRALGARIGPGVLILSRNVPLCTDLLTIGAGSVIRKDSFFNGYRAQAGVIRTGRITLGTGAFVGEATVLDIDTQVGSGAQLGHSSALLPGQRIPDGERWHGCPAQRTTVDYQRCEPTTLSRSRPVLYGLGQLLNRLAVSGPAMFGISMLLVYLLPGLGDTLYGDAPPDIGDLQFYLPQLAAIAALLLGGTLVGLAAVTTLPRLLHRALTPGRVYPLYGSRYAVQRTIARVTNVRFFTTLFGDSSYITGYLSALGYRLTPVQQTGSNFGIAVKHEAPYLTTVGTGTIVSDGLSLMNAEFSATSFRMVGVGVSADSFIGNNIVFPSGARVGAGCLVATKTLLPLDGPVRENVGLLGSPPFEIPRSVHRDTVSDHPTTPEQLRPRLAAKNRHNLATMAAFLASRWLYLIMIILLVEIGTGTRLGHGTGTIALAVALIPAASAAYFIVIERAALGFRPLQPRTCSIYNRSFWRHERYWKLSTSIYLNLFNGTPMKSWIWRALGVRVGKMLYDDGCGIPEKSLITIGNHCTLNQASVMQGHSLEDGIFTSDRVVIGDNVTLSTGAFVHYGVAIGAGATLAADSFLMKGEQIPAHQHWHGNPARNILERSSQH